MTPDPPKYIPPQPDPALGILQQQNEQQQTLAIQERTSADTARLMQTFGTRLALGGQQATPLLAPALRSAPSYGTKLVLNQPSGAI